MRKTPPAPHAPPAVTLSVGGDAWAIRVLPGRLALAGREVATLTDARARVVTVTDGTGDAAFGHALLVAMRQSLYDRGAAPLPPEAYDRTDERGRHVCPHCPRRFARVGMFGRHVRTAHGVEPCTGLPRHDAPARDYGRRDERGRHVCPDCPRRYRSVSGFVRHLHRGHGTGGDPPRSAARAATGAPAGVARRAGEAPPPWERPGWRTEVLENVEYDGETVSFTVGLKEPGDLEHDSSDTLAVVYARPYRTAGEAEEVAADIASDPATFRGAAALPGVVDRRAVVAAKFPAGGKGARRG